MKHGRRVNTFSAQSVRALASAAGAVAIAAAPQLQAQDPTIQEIVVTGSRIPQPNLTSISPVTSIGAEAVKIEGVTRVEDLINNLPQAFADLGGNLSNGSTGTATVNLRNLGPQRTLVLVNSRRLMPGDPTQNGQASPDLNQIPAALIERVEVLTGGASAVYGADAVAGVVNFIMNDKFEGVRVDAQYSLYQHNNDSDIADIVRARNFKLPDSNITDGTTSDFTFVAGINTPDGRGNATVYLGYRQLEAIRQDARDFSACTLASSERAEPSPFGCGGSGTPACRASSSAPAIRSADRSTATSRRSPAARCVPAAATDQFNFAPDNYYQRPDERKTAGLFAHYDFSEKASVYTEFMFMDDRTQRADRGERRVPRRRPGPAAVLRRPRDQLRQSVPLGGHGAAVLRRRSRRAGDVLITIGRRNVEGGGRLDDLRHTSFRGVVGLRGDIADALELRRLRPVRHVDPRRERSRTTSRATRLGKALNAVVDNSPGSTTFGQIVCRVNADADLSNNDPRCVPYNIFQPGGVTPDQLAYLQVPGLVGGLDDGAGAERIGLRRPRRTAKLPTANDGARGRVRCGVSLGALGAAHRPGLPDRRPGRAGRADAGHDRLVQRARAVHRGAPAVDPGQAVRALAVARSGLPLLGLQPRLRDRHLQARTRLGAGARTSVSAAATSARCARRTSRSCSCSRACSSRQRRSVREPVGGDAPSGVTEECARHRRAAGAVRQHPREPGRAVQRPGRRQPGRSQPEESDTYSFGIVLTPQFAPSLSLSVDYFDIKVDKLIGTIGGDFILDSCLHGRSEFCNQIHRDANGSLWLGDTRLRRRSDQQHRLVADKGVDLEANYRFEHRARREPRR